MFPKQQNNTKPLFLVDKYSKYPKSIERRTPGVSVCLLLVCLLASQSMTLLFDGIAQCAPSEPPYKAQTYRTHHSPTKSGIHNSKKRNRYYVTKTHGRYHNSNESQSENSTKNARTQNRKHKT